MKMLLLFLFAFANAENAIAQTEAAIRKHYQDVNTQIHDSKILRHEGPLYQDRWISNAQQRAWPAVGIYTDTVDFWYDDPPNHVPAEDRDPKTVLLKIETSGQSSISYIKKEFLFQEGKLIFYYCNQAEEGHGWETRVWFSNGKVLKTNIRVNEEEVKPEDVEYKDVRADIPAIEKEAKKLQELFVRNMY